MQLYVVRRSGAVADMQALKDVAARSAKIGNDEMPDRVRWIRSCVVEESDRRVGTVCIYEAKDPDSTREHARRAGIPADDIVPVLDSVLARPVPEFRPEP